MKSSVKIAYQSRFGEDNIGDREPIIRVDLDLLSDDPRDNLTKDLFKGTFPKLGCSELQPSIMEKTGKKVFVIYALSREEQLYQKADTLYTAFLSMYGPTLERTYDSIAVTFADTETKERSAGVRPIDYIYNRDEDFIAAVTKDFLEFKEKLKKEFMDSITIDFSRGKEFSKIV